VEEILEGIKTRVTQHPGPPGVASFRTPYLHDSEASISDRTTTRNATPLYASAKPTARQAVSVKTMPGQTAGRSREDDYEAPFEGGVTIFYLLSHGDSAYRGEFL
jgi:hypothetical protein